MTNALLNPKLVPATIDDYLTIQNMARFYLYDMSRSCGFISEDWACPSDGLYECADFKSYFVESTRKAYFIKVEEELAGFVLLNQEGKLPNTEWNMGEFFVMGKFQGKKIASQIVQEVWNQHPGYWEVSVIPENKPALSFWRKVIAQFTHDHYQEKLLDIDYDGHMSQRYILSFDTLTNQQETNKNDYDADYQIDFVDEIDEVLEKQMRDDLVAYETSHGVNVNYKRVSVLMSDKKGRVLGVINAFTAYAEIYIDDFWIDKPYRGKGYGTKLLEALENQFKGQGFNNINLVTSNFSAPGFYKKCGFMTEFIRENIQNPQLTKIFFVKFFNEERETQGLLKMNNE